MLHMSSLKKADINLTLKALGFLLPVQHWGCPSTISLCKIRSRHSSELKLLSRADSLYYVLQNMLI